MTDVAARSFVPGDQVDVLSVLLERSATGDTAAFADLYDAVASRVHGLVLRVLRDARPAEEVTVDVFLEVWRTASSYDAGRGSAVSWILAIAHRRAVDRVRATTSDRTTEPAPVGTRVRTDLHVVERQALELAYLNGLTHAQVARRMDVSVATTATRIRTALVALRDEVRVSAPAVGGARTA